MPTILTGAVRTLDVRAEGTRVLVLENGRAILDLPYSVAMALSRALRIKALEAEEEAEAERIVFDQAILTRLGVPVGLSNRPDIQREAAKEAAWNSTLRRYIPPSRAQGIASQAIVGTPIVKQYPPLEVKRE